MCVSICCTATLIVRKGGIALLLLKPVALLVTLARLEHWLHTLPVPVIITCGAVPKPARLSRPVIYPETLENDTSFYAYVKNSSSGS